MKSSLKQSLNLWLLPSSKKEMKRRIWPIAVGLGYILLIGTLGGLKARHVAMGLLCFLDAYNLRTRTFLKYFLPFILTGTSYDFMRYFYWQGIEGHVHVSEPYELEKKLFGIMFNGKLLTPNEYFQINTHKVLDFFCGFAYITFVFEYLTAAFWLFFTKRLKLLNIFGWCFYLMNMLGFATYFIYPASPPWYVSMYGLGPAKMYIGSTPAGAARFDALFGTHFFDTMYGQSVDIHGAIPSLHVAYPLLVMWIAFTTKLLRPVAVAFFFLMCFSAVYLNHHYIIDVILGIMYALFSLEVVKKLNQKYWKKEGI